MRLLALDTATSATTVAVHDGVRVLARATDSIQHAEVLARLIRDVLVEAQTGVADLTHIACGVGPGPFTGLRVGLVTARSMAHVLGIPSVGVCTLDAIAREHQHEDPRPITVVTRARRRESYWASYDAAGRRVAGPEVASNDTLTFSGDVVGGPDSPAVPDAAWIAQLAVDAMSRGERVAPAGASTREQSADGDGSNTAAFISGRTLLAMEALYLRRPDAVPSTKAVAAPAVTVNVRRMRWWDVEIVSQMEPHLFPATAWSAGTFWSELAGVPQSRHYVVAEDSGDIVGYAGMAIYPPEAEVQTIAVAPSVQGRGVGRLLLDAIMAAAYARECSRVLLEVRADNMTAIRLYESCGFTANGRRRDYYGPGADALLMQRGTR